MAEKRRRIPVRSRFGDDEDEDDLVGPRTGGTRPSRGEGPRARPRRAPARRGGDRAWLRSMVADIPHFLKLLWGLARDSRVSKVDKAIVLGALGYAALPADVIPDWIPGLGEVEDVLLIAVALSRLLGNAGEEVLMDHWEGDEEMLVTVLDALDAATQYIPGPIRGLLAGRR
jgi:uncharacterized membrane protein YkvA (DUF1232 family)